MHAADLVMDVLGDDAPIRVEAFDGSSGGPAGTATTLRIVRPEALHRVVAARGREIGFARAIVAGDIAIEGDIFGLFDVADRVRTPSLHPSTLRSAAALLGVESVRDLSRLRPLPPLPEENRLRGRIHSLTRDAEAISSHYDVSNAFYRIVLGESMTYSCAVYDAAADSLLDAQINKHELVCRKIALQPGMRHLDIGCGWGSMVLHAARHHGVRSVGVTLSTEQAELARKRVADAGLEDRIEVRLQDYRDITDGPFDAISSIGMSEHVGGPAELATYFAKVRSQLAAGGRFLNHAIGRSPHAEPAGRNGFIQRFVFPDGELHELGATTSSLQEAGFEALHTESFRLHYARTLRSWVRNLEDRWEDAVAEVGERRAQVWRLYMAGSAVAFERGDIQLHQILAVHEGASEETIPLRPDW